jgi:hypothetical protein
MNSSATIRASEVRKALVTMQNGGPRFAGRSGKKKTSYGMSELLRFFITDVYGQVGESMEMFFFSTFFFE